MDGADPIILEVNQELAPDDFQDSGLSWETLGLINVDSNELTVTLNDDANEFVIADAVRIERFNDSIILDNESETFNEIVEFTPPDIIVNELSEGFLGSQLEVPGNASIMLTFSQALLDDLDISMIKRVTDMFLVTTTYVPQPDASNQVMFRINYNGTTVSTVIDQTKIVPSFSDAPNLSTLLQNVALCKNDFLEAQLTIPVERNLQVVINQVQTPFLYDSTFVIPVNRLEFQRYNIPEDIDFDGDQMCVLIPLSINE